MRTGPFGRACICAWPSEPPVSVRLVAPAVAGDHYPLLETLPRCLDFTALHVKHFAAQRVWSIQVAGNHNDAEPQLRGPEWPGDGRTSSRLGNPVGGRVDTATEIKRNANPLLNDG